jgi:CHAT domain
VGIWNFVPTTNAQRNYFAKVAKENAGRFQYQISEDPETFLSVCTSRIVYFFSHGHTAKPASTASLASYDMAQAWKEWLENPQETDSAWMREYRTRKLVELERLTSDVNAFSETYILLQNGRLLLRELENRFDLESDALVFLNMCESAQVFSCLSGGLIEGFLKKGARGVVGSEIPMIDAFADLFSRELFDRLLFGSGKAGPEPLGTALRALRCKYLDLNNPLGFAYTYFGDTSAKFGLVENG